MKIIYISDDGKEFDNEFDCEEYEWKLNHSNLEDVLLYDKDGNKMHDVFSQETYGIVEKIVVPNENALKDFQDLADYTGFCCYGDVIECGEWIFDYDKEKFVKV